MGKSIVVFLLFVLISLSGYAYDPPDLALVYTDADIHTPSACETAIANLGWNALIINDDTDAFNDQFYPYANWDIVVVECFSGDALCEIIDSLDGFISGEYGSGGYGLKTVMFTSALDNCSNVGFWANLGIIYEADISDPYDVYTWYDPDDFFSDPNSIPGPFAVDYSGTVDMGDKASTTSPPFYGTPYDFAGTTETDIPGEGVIFYSGQVYIFEGEPTCWWGPHLIATMNTDCMSDQIMAAQLWENALYNIWDCDYAMSVNSASLGEIKAAFK